MPLIAASGRVDNRRKRRRPGRLGEDCGVEQPGSAGQEAPLVGGKVLPVLATGEPARASGFGHYSSIWPGMRPRHY